MRSTGKSEAAPLRMLRHHYIIAAGSAMDGCQDPIVILHDDADVLTVRVECEVARLRVVPSNCVAIAVLRVRAASMSDEVFAATGINYLVACKA